MAGQPARGYSWPPFQRNNQVGLRHGAFSKRRFEPLARELIEGVLAEHPHLGRHPEALASWADSEARAWLLRDWLTGHGMFTEGKTTEGAIKFLIQFDRRAEAGRKALGLDPRSELELVREAAEAEASRFDLDALRERGRKALDAREAT
jgi:ribulose-5-phosphate 4-epimerase/fuculose-1-phosphate aldolase